MKKYLILLAGAAMMVFQACQENMTLNYVENSKNSGDEIMFANYVKGITRASKTSGESFVQGDQIGVYGFQRTNEGDIAQLFNKQLVSNDGEAWSYDPPRYWEKNSTYDFYAVYPYSMDNSFNKETRLFTITDFTVQDDATQQTDLMIAKRITNRKPYNVVNLEFNHILSNVGFFIKTADNFSTTGINRIVVTSFDVTGLYGKGTFTQTGWSSNVFTGAWAPDATSVYDMPEVRDSIYYIGDATAKTLAADLLLLPQDINDNAKINIKFKIVYDDETEMMVNRTIALNQIVGKKASAPADDAVILAKWDPNYRYNYTISVNPAITEHGGEHLPIANPDHDQPELNNQDPDNPIVPNVNIIAIDNDGDDIPDEWWVDEDLDDVKDYPIIWEDIDGDGKLEGLPDRDNDGNPDYTDDDEYPDVIWLDTDGDGVVETELERPKTEPVGPGPADDPEDPNYPTIPYVDYDGNEGGGYKVPTAWLIKDDNGEYHVDTNGDHQSNYNVVWKDIDGDGLLEGIVDYDGDGKATEADNIDGDGKDYLDNDNEYDVILYCQVDDEGNYITDPETGEVIWYELEKDPGTPYIPEITNLIEFSAEVVDWSDTYEANHVLDN